MASLNRILKKVKFFSGFNLLSVGLFFFFFCFSHMPMFHLLFFFYILPKVSPVYPP